MKGIDERAVLEEKFKEMLLSLDEAEFWDFLSELYLPDDLDIYIELTLEYVTPSIERLKGAIEIIKRLKGNTGDEEK